ncbi:MAG: enoyl-CoA hydratase/isomerase family protein, partial [Candidatus Hydrogenedentes bacterium]|nr:enoyl-CoA hydratase/isomerase family protein [Candidatus Hydrogenedentota bacterium]
MSERHPDGQITTERRGHVFLMGLDRPEKYNGLTPKMFQELTDAYNTLNDDPDLWVGVLFAHGKHFTAGLELPKFVQHMQEGTDPFAPGGVDVFALKKKLTKPLATAVQG